MTSSSAFPLITSAVKLLTYLVVSVTLFALARRSRTPGLGWLCLAAGVWPILSSIAQSVAFAVLARGYGPGGMAASLLIVSTPLLIIGAVLIIVAGVRLSRAGRPLPAEPLCPQCGYNLTGLPEDRCPECGTRFVFEVRYLVRKA